MPGGGDPPAQKTAMTQSNADGGRLGGRDWLLAVLLVVVTVLAYQPVWHAGFIWDDDSWTTLLFPGMGNVSGLLAVWLHPTVLQQYYPVTASTFWLDHLLWGFRPLPYHLENVLGHGLSAVLFWRWLRRLKLPGAWLAGAILAVHPLMVESVAWITERKNVVSLLCYLGALHAYGRFMRYWDTEPTGVEGRSTPAPDWRAYGLAGVFFVMALLAKATAFSFPAVVLLVCWWKRGRLRWRADVLPILPFFAVSIGLGLFTSWLEKHHVGASGRDWAITFPERCLIAGRALWFYAGKVFWPARLCFIYPRWQLNAASPGQWLYPAAAAAALLALWLGRKRIGRGPAAAAFIFAGTLFPVLGFMNAYYMRFSFVCDHLAYVSSLALIAPAAAVVARVGEKWRTRLAVFALAAAALAALFVITRRQSAMYADVETLWQTTLRQNPDCWMARNNLGSALLQEGKVDEAIAHFQTALQLKPDYAEAHNNFGIALLQEGRVDEAIAQCQTTLQLRPDYAEAYNNLGNALFQKGRLDEAIAHLQQAVQMNPDYADADFNLGNVLLQTGKVDEAILQFQKALRVKPDYTEAHNNLGNALLEKGDVGQAIAQYRKALQSNPDYVNAQNNLASVLAICPQASLRNGKQAVELAERANQLTGGGNPATLCTLAAAYAEAGRFPEAVATAQRALDLAEKQSNTALAAVLRSQMKLYQAGVPFHLQ